MSTKMKGLFKGLRYISQIFDEDQQKEQDFQIGLPTDVKHVAHIGWDGPGSANSTSVDSPNWMKDIGSTGKDNGEVKWVSEDSKRAQRTKKEKDQQQGEGSSKPSRRRSTDNNPLDTSPKAAKPSRRQSSDNKSAGGGGESKPRQSRRNPAKDPSDAAAGQPSQDADAAPKKTRRKKSVSGEQAGPRRPKNRSAANSVEASGVDGGVQKLISDDEEREDRGRTAQMKGSLQS